METTVLIEEPLLITRKASRGSAYLKTCSWYEEPKSSGGSNFEFGQRSKTVRNRKDAYGFRPMSPFKATYVKRVQPVGTTRIERPTHCSPYYETSGGINNGMEGHFRSLLDRMSLPSEQSQDLLIMRAEGALRQQDINLLQFAAFLPSTLKNIKENLIKMDSLLDILHDKRKLMQRFNGADYSSLYLQWLFVWNQLHRDIVGGARFLKKQSRPIGSLVTGRARSESSTDFMDVRTVNAGYHPAGRATCSTFVEVKQQAVSVARISCDVKYRRNALGIDNPMYLFWDLLRWSWVIDQIVDIGLFIQSISSTHGLEFLGTSYTRRVTNTSTVEIDGTSNINGLAITSNYSPGSSVRKNVDRLVRSSTTHTVTVRNPFQNSIAVTAAVAAAIGIKMRNVDIDPVLRRA